MEWNNWCRLCGATSGQTEVPESILLLASQIFEIPSKDLRMCPECIDSIKVIQQLIQKAKGLKRLFSGLAEENASDLNLLRLNAYRAHFNLDPIVLETHTKSHQNLSQSTEEYQSGYEDYEEYRLEEGEEAILTESVEEIESNLIVRDEYDIEEEVYLEEEIAESQDYYIEEQENVTAESVTEAAQTEDEMLFTFKCHFCPAPEFLKMKQLALHCKNVHNSLPQVKCCSSECDSVLTTWRRLMIHKEKHFPNEQKLRCHICQKVYATDVGLEKHIKTHSIRFICSQCGKEFKEVKTLRWHEQTHTKPVEDRKTVECPYACGLKFISKQACRNHVGTKHVQDIVVSCKVLNCNKSFYTRKAYNEHKRNAHGERKFNCDQCSFKARTKPALNVHKDIHRTSETFSCDLCNAVFNGYRKLRSHMVCHSTVTPYQCQVCDSAFKRSKELKSHILIHTKERPFSCQFCSKTFANNANCRKHKVSEHFEELKAWEVENGVGGRKHLECYQ